MAQSSFLSPSLKHTHTAHKHTHTQEGRKADTHRPVGPKSLKKQTEYKYLKPALASTVAEAFSVLILTPSAAAAAAYQLSSPPSSAARLCCNGTSAPLSHPILSHTGLQQGQQQCSTHTHTHTHSGG